jgi:hypothetical protein
VCLTRPRAQLLDCGAEGGFVHRISEDFLFMRILLNLNFTLLEGIKDRV